MWYEIEYIMESYWTTSEENSCKSWHLEAWQMYVDGDKTLNNFERV